MHTYLKRPNGSYTIGQWLPDVNGITAFKSPLFDVATLQDALAAVNMMNGGDRDATFEVTKEH